MIPRTAIVTALEQMPTFPGVALRVTELLRCELSTVADLEAAVRFDPALTANLLRLANTAAFGCYRQVTDVAMAVSLLGRQRLQDLVITAAFGQLLPARLPGYGLDAAGLWRHCSAVAVLAVKLGELLGQAPCGPLFTAGLLHDLGKLALGAFLAQVEPAVRSRLQQGSSFCGAERELLGLDHAQLGGELAERWGLPGAIVQVVAGHHLPDAPPLPGGASGPPSTLVDLVHVADCLAHVLGLGADVGELSRRLEDGPVQRLGLRITHVEQVASLSLAPIEELDELFSRLVGGCR